MLATYWDPTQHKIKYDVLDVKCLSFNIELQHIGMSSIKKKELCFTLHGNLIQVLYLKLHTDRPIVPHAETNMSAYHSPKQRLH